MGTMWDAKIEYLRESRKDMWNLDYLQFLVQNVWKIQTPVSVVDFGCGLGYLAASLMPLLPDGSRYTGLDNSDGLLRQARATFADAEWEVAFVQQDVTRYVPQERYDIAICQTALVHIPHPAAVLEKMAQSVLPGGRVICIEPNWAFTNTGVYRHGMEVYTYADWGLLQKLFDTELRRSGVDRYIGIKLPAMMRDLGLRNIDVRINDRGNLQLKQPDASILVKDREERRENRFDNPAFYAAAGLEPAEAERMVEDILRTEEYENRHDGPLPIVSAMAWIISYGEKG